MDRATARCCIGGRGATAKGSERYGDNKILAMHSNMGCMGSARDNKAGVMGVGYVVVPSRLQPGGVGVSDAS